MRGNYFLGKKLDCSAVDEYDLFKHRPLVSCHIVKLHSETYAFVNINNRSAHSFGPVLGQGQFELYNFFGPNAGYGVHITSAEADIRKANLTFSGYALQYDRQRHVYAILRSFNHFVHNLKRLELPTPRTSFSATAYSAFS